MAYDDVAEVTVSTTGAALPQPAFSVPLILSTSNRFAERFREYGDMDELEADGFVAADPEHQLATKLLSASGSRVDTFALGRLASLPTQRFSVTPVVANSTVYELEVGTETVTYTSDASATAAEIIGGLKTAIDALSLPITTSDQTTYLRIAVDTAGDNLHVAPVNRSLLRIAMDHADPGVAADLTAIEAENSNWYWVLNAFDSQAMATAIAAWVQTRTKAYAASTCDTSQAQTTASGATDLGGAFKTANYDRSVVFFGNASDAFRAAAALGEMLTKDPGKGVTWAFKELEGVEDDALTSAEQSNLRGRNVNYSYVLGNRSITYPGVNSKGTYVDQVWGIDWLVSEMQTAVAQLLVDSDVIPYTNAGAQMILGALREKTLIAVRRGFLADNPEPTWNVPDVSEQSTQDRLDRILNEVEGVAYLARAIHKTMVRIRLE